MITFFHKGNLDIPRIYWCARKLMRYDISFLQVMLAAPINLNVCLPSNAYPKHGLVMVKMIAEIFLMNNIAKVRKYFFYRIIGTGSSTQFVTIWTSSVFSSHEASGFLQLKSLQKSFWAVFYGYDFLEYIAASTMVCTEQTI